MTDTRRWCDWCESPIRPDHTHLDRHCQRCHDEIEHLRRIELIPVPLPNLTRPAVATRAVLDRAGGTDLWVQRMASVFRDLAGFADEMPMVYARYTDYGLWIGILDDRYVFDLPRTDSPVAPWPRSTTEQLRERHDRAAAAIRALAVR